MTFSESQNLRVSVAVLDATEVSLDGQKDTGVPGAAVLQQGSGGLSGALRSSAVEGRGCNTKQSSTLNIHLRVDTNRLTSSANKHTRCLSPLCLHWVLLSR